MYVPSYTSHILSHQLQVATVLDTTAYRTFLSSQNILWQCHSFVYSTVICRIIHAFSQYAGYLPCAWPYSTNWGYISGYDKQNFCFPGTYTSTYKACIQMSVCTNSLKKDIPGKQIVNCWVLFLFFFNLGSSPVWFLWDVALSSTFRPLNFRHLIWADLHAQMAYTFDLPLSVGCHC